MIVQGVVKPAPGLDFASKPDVRLGSWTTKLKASRIDQAMAAR